MTNLESKIKEYREYKRMIEELAALADSLADELKAAVEESGESKLIIGEYKLSYTDCTRHDLDKKALKEGMPDVYSLYETTTTYKRFMVA